MAANVTWAVDADGTWTTATNWSSNPALPGVGDDVTISRAAGNFLVTLASGSQSINSLVSDERLTLTGGTLTLAAGSTVNNTFTLAGGTLGGPGALTLNAPATWDTGTLTSTVVGTGTNFLAGLSITGGGAKSLSRRTLTNSAAATWTAGQVNSGSAADFVNAATGTFNNTFDGNWLYNLGGGLSTFTNLGTFTKSAGAGATVFTSAFHSSGTVNVNSGTLQLSAGSTHSGGVNVAASAVLDFASGTHLLNSGTTVGGAGAVAVTAGTVTVGAPVAVSAPLSLAGGVVNGAGALTLAGPATWASGTFGGTGSTDVNAGLTIDTAGAKSLTQRTINNRSTTTWAAGQVNTGSAAEFVNAAGATFNNTFDGSWLYNLGGGFTSFTNLGTFDKTAGAGTTVFTTAFDNAAVVNVNSGTLQFAAGGTNSGAFAIAPAATLQFAGSTYTLNSGTTISGGNSASVAVTAGNLTVNAPMTLSAPFSLAGGTLNGAGAVTLADPATWSSGTFAGVGSTTFAGALTIDTGSAKSLSQRTLVNAAATTWSAGQVNTGAVANFVNAAGATFTNTFDGNWLYNLGGGLSTFTNQGTFHKSAGAGTTTISSALNNSGTVNVSAGTLSLVGGGANGAAFVVAAPATLEFSSAYALNAGTTITGAGTASLNAGTLTVNAPVTLAVANFAYAGGTLSGAATLTHAAPATWTASTIGGAGATNFNAGLAIQGNVAKSLSQRTLNNHSTTTWSAGQVNTGSVAEFVNAPGATFNNTFDGSWLYNLGGGLTTFTNQGAFNKTAGAGTTTISSAFDNTGTVGIATGTVTLAGGGAHSSAINVAAPGALQFAGGTHNLNAGTTLSGAGAGALTAGTLTVNAAVSLSVAAFNFTSGTQNGAGALTLTGAANWADTAFTGTGATNFIGPLVLSANVARAFSQRTLTAASNTTWSAGQVNTGSLAHFTNAVTGNFNNTFDGSWLYNLGGGLTSFTNLGTLSKTAGAGTTTFTPTFSSTGTVNANSGTLSFNTVTQHVGSSLTAGTWNVNNATLVFATGADISTVGPSAAVRLSGAGSVFTRVNPIATNQGSFTVTNGRNFATVGALANSGALTAGPSSILAVNGNLDNTGTVTSSGNLTANSATQLSGTTLTGGTWVASNGTIAITSGSNVTTIGPSATVRLSGAASVFAKVNAVASNQGVFTISDGRAFTTAGSLANSGTITVGASSTLKVVGVLTNANAVDLAPGTLLLDYTGASPIDTLRGQLFTGRAGGTWTGPGVRSSTAAVHPQLLTAIGYAEASALLGLAGAATTTYAGLTVDATTVLTKFTYYGDANLNGRIDRDDFALTDRGFVRGLTGWINGDYNYDGTINLGDYMLIDRSLLLQGTPLSVDLIAQREKQFGVGYVAGLLATVPEPALGCTLSAIPMILTRRRRSG
jgi:hypothetical protein